MLIACYKIYNSAQFLFSSVLSVLPYVDKFIFVDGIIKGREAIKNLGETYYSSDQTRNLLSKIEAEHKIEMEWVEPPEHGWEDMVVARNKYFEYGEEGDVYFVIDDDEILVGQLPQDLDAFMKSKDNCGWINVITIRNFYPFVLARNRHGRFYKRHSEPIQYRAHHWDVRDSAGNLVVQSPSKQFEFEHSHLIHLKHLRYTPYREAQIRYEAWAAEQRRQGKWGY